VDVVIGEVKADQGGRDGRDALEVEGYFVAIAVSVEADHHAPAFSLQGKGMQVIIKKRLPRLSKDEKRKQQ
jgi:hypothetical protein